MAAKWPHVGVCAFGAEGWGEMPSKLRRGDVGNNGAVDKCG